MYVSLCRMDQPETVFADVLFMIGCLENAHHVTAFKALLNPDSERVLQDNGPYRLPCRDIQ